MNTIEESVGRLECMGMDYADEPSNAALTKSIEKWARYYNVSDIAINELKEIIDLDVVLL